MHDISTYLDKLSSQANAEGGWGYSPGQQAHLEPTCFALLALSLEPEKFAGIIHRGKESLRRFECDGTYILPSGREEAVWTTELVLFVQAALGCPEAETRRTAARVLALSGRVPDDPKVAEMHDIDVKLRGWAWAESNFSWAEPTAWACLALRRAGVGAHPRVHEGIRLLLDRTQDTGGINYGNRHIFGNITEPIPGPTALMLLAVQGAGSSGDRDRSELHPRVQASLDYLSKAAFPDDDLDHLCWAKLALEVYRDRPGLAETLEELDRHILSAYQARMESNWKKPSVMREALTALALGVDRKNDFRIDSVVEQEALQPLLPVSRKRPLSQRIRSAFRGLVLNAVGNLRPLPLHSAVHIAPVSDYDADLADILRRQYQEFRERVPLKGKRVVLKPNLVEYHRDKVINTNPRVVAAAIELCKHEGAAEIIVAEGPGHWRNVEYLVSASGLGDVLRHYGVPFVDLNHDDPVKTLNLGRMTGLEYLYLSQTAATAEVLISMPKLKTHHWAGATLSLKNLFGIVPGICYGWPKNELHWRGVDNSIVDIALTRMPDLAIVDGIIGMEGDGPLKGSAKHVGALIMGCDLLAVDATCCRLMKLNPEKLNYLMMGQFKRLGQLREAAIPQIGERIETLARPFETLEQFRQLYMGRPA